MARIGVKITLKYWLETENVFSSPTIRLVFDVNINRQLAINGNIITHYWGIKKHGIEYVKLTYSLYPGSVDIDGGWIAHPYSYDQMLFWGEQK